MPSDQNAAPDIRIGISGWRYAPWRGTFYPPGLTQARELEYASQRVNSIEINGSFYALQRPSSYQTWAMQVPDDFVFAVKGGRFVTHMKKLVDVEVPVANFFASGVLALGRRLGPVLWQLPPSLGFDEARLESFFRLLPRSTREAAALAAGHDERLDGEGRTWLAVDEDRPLRYALEVRHGSFADQSVRERLTELLTRYGIALVVADSAGRWPVLEALTGDLVYVRLHGDKELYVSGYSDDALDSWAERIRGWAASGHDVHVYFDNDAKVHAPYDAMALAERLRLDPSSGPRTDLRRDP